MEVIRQGEKNLANCLDCGSILRFEQRDIYREQHEIEYDFDSYDCYYVNCLCGSKICVTSKISSGVAERVKRFEKEREMSDFDL